MKIVTISNFCHNIRCHYNRKPLCCEIHSISYDYLVHFQLCFVAVILVLIRCSSSSSSSSSSTVIIVLVCLLILTFTSLILVIYSIYPDGSRSLTCPPDTTGHLSKHENCGKFAKDGSRSLTCPPDRTGPTCLLPICQVTRWKS